MKLQKTLIALLAVVTAATSLTACGEKSAMDELESYVNEANDSLSKSKTTTTKTTTQTTTSDNLEEIDPFDGLEVQFDGIAPYITIGFNNSKCEQVVQDYVTFTYEEDNIRNGDSVTITAEYNINNVEAEGYKFSQDEKSYTASGCSEYVEDITTIDTAELDTEIQEYMEAHYLDASYGFGKVHSIMGADVYDEGSGFDNQCKNKVVDSSYFCTLKSNRIEVDGNDEINYYYKVYKNTYTLTGGDLGDHDVDVYVCIYVKNISVDEDGNLNYDPELGHNADKSKETAFYDGIGVKKEDFNVSEITA